MPPDIFAETDWNFSHHSSQMSAQILNEKKQMSFVDGRLFEAVLQVCARKHQDPSLRSYFGSSRRIHLIDGQPKCPQPQVFPPPNDK
jgi:hypothetical protein